MKQDEKWLRLAIELSGRCIPVASAFCVGAVIVDSHGKEIATGYSRETADDKHAEEIAIEKAVQAQKNLAGSTIYSSLEPCGERLSGRKTCVERIIASGIKKVVFGSYEPEVFVKGEGEELLQKAGIETVFVETIDFNPLQ